MQTYFYLPEMFKVCTSVYLLPAVKVKGGGGVEIDAQQRSLLTCRG